MALSCSVNYVLLNARICKLRKSRSNFLYYIIFPQGAHLVHWLWYQAINQDTVSSSPTVSTKPSGWPWASDTQPQEAWNDKIEGT